MAAPVISDGLYAEVSQFYAGQMQALDGGELAAYAETFTEDATFSHSPGREPARTRHGILRDLVEVNERFVADPQQRRHMFTMLNLAPQPDGTIRSTVYALVLATRSGAAPELVRTCVVHDVLARVDGELRNQARRVELDGLD